MVVGRGGRKDIELDGVDRHSIRNVKGWKKEKEREKASSLFIGQGPNILLGPVSQPSLANG